jgi:hypothetical protein
MNSRDRQFDVDQHIQALASEAAAERLAAAHVREHEAEHRAHPLPQHDHPTAGLRGVLGRRLIGLGTAIAGTGREAGASRPA